MTAGVVDLFGRSCRIVVNTTAITNLRGDGLDVTFRVVRHNRLEPNVADVQIFNLPKAIRDRLTAQYNEARRKAIEDRLADASKPVIAGKELEPGVGPFGRMRVEAGYGEDLEILSEGDITHLEHERASSGTEWITRVRAQDGYVAWRYGFISESLGTGVDIGDVQRIISGSMKAALSPRSEAVLSGAIDGFKTTKVPNGYVMHGPSREVMADLVDSLNLIITFQNGELVLVPADDALQDLAVVLGPETGLLDPVVTQELGKVTAPSLLNPKLVPHRQVHLTGTDGKVIGGGLFRVDEVEHRGQTLGEDWTSLSRLRPTDLLVAS